MPMRLSRIAAGTVAALAAALGCAALATQPTMHQRADIIWYSAAVPATDTAPASAPAVDPSSPDVAPF